MLLGYGTNGATGGGDSGGQKPVTMSEPSLVTTETPRREGISSRVEIITRVAIS